MEYRSDGIIFVGDVNATLPCILKAEKLGIRVVRIEAGSTSFVSAVTEEIFMILPDYNVDILIPAEHSENENLNN